VTSLDPIIRPDPIRSPSLAKKPSATLFLLFLPRLLQATSQPLGLDHIIDVLREVFCLQGDTEFVDASRAKSGHGDEGS